MEIDFPPFVPPAEPQVMFPFFQPNGESFLTLLGRDDVLERINEILLPVPQDRQMRPQKYWPIIISTSRGMGKTFLLKMVGMQKVKAELKNVWIEDAIQCGRVLSFDFAKETINPAIETSEDINTFLASLMVYFLCLHFDGTQVDGINFEKIDFKNVVKFVGKQKKFNDWKSKYLQHGPDVMIEEYMRLTNIAFSVDPKTEMYNAPPVFLFDEVQSLTKPTGIQSKFLQNNPQFHTLLSLLLTALATKHYPVCICTGTSNGEIISITDNSVIIPQVLSLTPLVNDYR